MALSLAITEHVVGLREPLPTAWGTLDRRPLFIVELSGSDGVIGRGEAAPLEAYDGVSSDACRAALKALAAELADIDEESPGHLVLDRLGAVTGIQQALAAVDLAFWDRGGRRAGQPVAELLASTSLGSVAVHRTIGGVAAAEATAITEQAIADGFTAFKIKVGLDPDGDIARVRAVREAAGPAARIKVDANGAWSVPQAVDMLRQLTARPIAIAAAEEPVSGGDAWPHLVAALNAAKVQLELTIDETADREPGAITRGPNVVELKLARSGGIGPLLVRASLAQLAGVQVALASTFDGPLGIAAAVHAAAALGIERPLGLATLDALNLDDIPQLAEWAAQLVPASGRIAVPSGPGLL